VSAGTLPTPGAGPAAVTPPAALQLEVPEATPPNADGWTAASPRLPSPLPQMSAYQLLQLVGLQDAFDSVQLPEDTQVFEQSRQMLVCHGSVCHSLLC
jgi:hypothetical protein